MREGSIVFGTAVALFAVFLASAGCSAGNSRTAELEECTRSFPEYSLVPLSKRENAALLQTLADRNPDLTYAEGYRYWLFQGPGEQGLLCENKAGGLGGLCSAAHWRLARQNGEWTIVGDLQPGICAIPRVHY